MYWCPMWALVPCFKDSSCDVRETSNHLSAGSCMFSLVHACLDLPNGAKCTIKGYLWYLYPQPLPVQTAPFPKCWWSCMVIAFLSGPSPCFFHQHPEGLHASKPRWYDVPLADEVGCRSLEVWLCPCPWLLLESDDFFGWLWYGHQLLRRFDCV